MLPPPKKFRVVDGDGEPWFASDHWPAIIEFIDEHEMVRVLPDGERIFKERHNMVGLPVRKLSPERFDVVRANGLVGGRSDAPASIEVRRSAWSRRTGWLAGRDGFDALAPPVSNAS